MAKALLWKLEEAVNSLQGHCFVALCAQGNDNHLLHHACLYECMGVMCIVYVHVYSTVHTRGGQKTVLSVLLYYFLLYFLR